MRPPTITITPIRNTANVGPEVSRVALVRAWRPHTAISVTATPMDAPGYPP